MRRALLACLLVLLVPAAEAQAKPKLRVKGVQGHPACTSSALGRAAGPPSPTATRWCLAKPLAVPSTQGRSHFGP